MTLRSKHPPYIGPNETKQWILQIVPSWIWQETCFMLKCSTNHFGWKQLWMQFTYVLMSNKSLALNNIWEKCEVGSDLTLYISVYLDALHIRWCSMRGWIRLMKNTPNVCSLDIVKALKYINSCIWFKKNSKLEIFCTWRIL